MSAPQHFLYLLEISTYQQSESGLKEEVVAIKVGITNNPSRRLLEIQSGTPFKVKPIRILKGNKETCRYCETQIKKRCRGYKLSERNFKSRYSETMDTRYQEWLLNLYNQLAEELEEVTINHN